MKYFIINDDIRKSVSTSCPVQNFRFTDLLNLDFISITVWSGTGRLIFLSICWCFCCFRLVNCVNPFAKNNRDLISSCTHNLITRVDDWIEISNLYIYNNIEHFVVVSRKKNINWNENGTSTPESNTQWHDNREIRIRFLIWRQVVFYDDDFRASYSILRAPYTEYWQLRRIAYTDYWQLVMINPKVSKPMKSGAQRKGKRWMCFLVTMGHIGCNEYTLINNNNNIVLTHVSECEWVCVCI